MCGADREAFDLFSAPCRRNFWNRVRRDWKNWWFWAMVLDDTRNRVCSKQKKGGA